VPSENRLEWQIRPITAAAAFGIIVTGRDVGVLIAPFLLTEVSQIGEETLSPDLSDFATSLENYTALLREVARADEAAEMEAHVKVIRSKSQ
jgi:hypothetical protein